MVTSWLLRHRLMPPRPPPPLKFPRCTRKHNTTLTKTWLIIAPAPIIKIRCSHAILHSIPDVNRMCCTLYCGSVVEK